MAQIMIAEKTADLITHRTHSWNLDTRLDNDLNTLIAKKQQLAIWKKGFIRDEVK